VNSFRSYRAVCSADGLVEILDAFDDILRWLFLTGQKTKRNH